MKKNIKEVKMEEPEMIVTQEQLKNNRIKALTNDNNRKHKEELHNTILVIIGLLLILVTMVITAKLTRSGYNGCIENGYSESYCRKNS